MEKIQVWRIIFYRLVRVSIYCPAKCVNVAQALERDIFLT